jgi:hypothetical protein
VLSGNICVWVRREMMMETIFGRVSFKKHFTAPINEVIFG